MKRIEEKDLGELAWPARFGKEFYLAQASVDEFSFACLYEGQPTSERLSLVPLHSWSEYDEGDLWDRQDSDTLLLP